MKKKSTYRFKTGANFKLLHYCANTFKDGYVCMSELKTWKFFVKKPTFDGGFWQGSGENEYLFCALKLPKRPASFAKHSLIRIAKGLAWFEEYPDAIAARDIRS